MLPSASATIALVGVLKSVIMAKVALQDLAASRIDRGSNSSGSIVKATMRVLGADPNSERSSWSNILFQRWGESFNP